MQGTEGESWDDKGEHEPVHQILPVPASGNACKWDILLGLFLGPEEAG